MISIDSPYYRTRWLHGTVHIEAKFPLEETVQMLSKALAIQFKEDIEGRYEEFPAWTTEAAGFEFAILGIPQPEYHGSEPIEEYELQIHSSQDEGSSSDQDWERFHAVEVSEFFARLVQKKTGLRCQACERPNAV